MCVAALEQKSDISISVFILPDAKMPVALPIVYENVLRMHTLIKSQGSQMFHKPQN